MTHVKKGLAALGGVGILALTLWIGSIIFVGLLLFGGAFLIYMRLRYGKQIKEARRQMQQGGLFMRNGRVYPPPAQHQTTPETDIEDVDYTVVEETARTDTKGRSQNSPWSAP